MTSHPVPEEVVEKVARALCLFTRVQPCEDIGDAWKRYLPLARAALQALEAEGWGKTRVKPLVWEQGRYGAQADTPIGPVCAYHNGTWTFMGMCERADGLLSAAQIAAEAYYAQRILSCLEGSE